MSRVNTNVRSLIAQRVLAKSNYTLNTSIERLSTCLKINTAKDNRAALIASENLRSAMAGIMTAIDNAGCASNIIGTAEGGLAEVSSLLTELTGLVGQAANTGGLSKKELGANQLQVDSILSTINRIAGATSFQGAKLLNGNYSYSASSTATSAFTSLSVTGLNAGKSKTFGITSGAATFSLGKVAETENAFIGLQSLSTGSLGDATLGYLSSLASGGANSLSATSLVQAQKILDKATKQVSQLRGRLGAFQKFTIGATVNSLGVAYENASAAESAIRDTDFAQETASLTRSQILSQAATTVLAQANAAPQAALNLLRG